MRYLITSLDLENLSSLYVRANACEIWDVLVWPSLMESIDEPTESL